MDWAKTKSIFIILFFLLNVFLTIILIYTIDNDSITKDTIYDARQALAERGVAITCDIPNFNGSMGTLTYDDMSLDKEKMIKNLSGRLEIKDGSKELDFPDEYSIVFRDSKPESAVPGLNNAEGILNFVSNVLKGTEIPVMDYHLDMIEEKDSQKTYIFKQKYKGLWIHENYILLIINNKNFSTHKTHFLSLMIERYHCYHTFHYNIKNKNKNIYFTTTSPNN
jgi:regulatory protein YycI of two-component signal transduction system YycFG